MGKSKKKQNRPGKKGGWRPDLRPARRNYWLRGTLRKRKIRRLMQCNGFTSEAEAEIFWQDQRQGRRIGSGVRRAGLPTSKEPVDKKSRKMKLWG